MVSDKPDKPKTRLGRILETTGVDWLPFALTGRSPHRMPPPSKTLDELRDIFGTTATDEDLAERAEECQGLLNAENERISHIEAKGTALLGFTGASLALSVSIVTGLLDPKRVLLPAVRTGGVVLFLLAASSFVTVVLILLQLLDVFRFKRSGPCAEDLLQVGLPRRDSAVRRAAALYHAQECNRNVANEKATFLGGGQLWFRNAIVLLFLLGALLCAFTGNDSKISDASSSALVPTPMQSPSPGPTHVPRAAASEWPKEPTPPVPRAATPTILPASPKKAPLTKLAS